MRKIFPSTEAIAEENSLLRVNVPGGFVNIYLLAGISRWNRSLYPEARKIKWRECKCHEAVEPMNRVTRLNAVEWSGCSERWIFMHKNGDMDRLIYHIQWFSALFASLRSLIHNLRAEYRKLCIRTVKLQCYELCGFAFIDACLHFQLHNK